MMETETFSGVFQNISQRAVFSYLNSLAEFHLVLPEGMSPETQSRMEVAELELHDFFKSLYHCMFHSPELFGLPLNEDCYIDEDEPNEKDKKQEVKARLKRPKDILTQGMDFLYLAGKIGRLEGQDITLPLEACAKYLQKSKSSKKFLQGLESAGLSVSIAGNQVTLHSSRFPEMMLALKTLAEHCTQYTQKDEPLGAFFFARCDFRALQKGYQPEPLDLYRMFTPTEYEYLAALHDFFIEMKYKPQCIIYDVFQWMVQYQGNKKIKGTPFYQVEYQDRYRKNLQVQVKCASTNRIASLLPQQSHALQADFFKRTYPCRGSECGWCNDKKSLGPTVIEFDGVKENKCWFTYSGIKELNDETVNLIKEYALMHERLLSLN